MKYGQQLEHESVPEWSFHNLDYNSLKHEIKVHTTRDQGVAMAIPGHQDAALRKFEDRLFAELCRQHNRLQLFVASKADEMSRRLDHIGANLEPFLSSDSNLTDDVVSTPPKRQRKLAKLERQLLCCGRDIDLLCRFVNAQVVAFRKILKKYRKWTGSSSLVVRFNAVMVDAKSFTRRDFTPLQARYDGLLAKVRALAPPSSEPSSLVSNNSRLPAPRTARRPVADHSSLSSRPIAPAKYWNEYDDGSDTGPVDDGYAIYIDPDSDPGFPGLAYAHAILAMPYKTASRWFGSRTTAERQPLLSDDRHRTRTRSRLHPPCASSGLDSDEEACSSSDGLPSDGYATHYALPSLNDQRALRYRERVLFWGTTACFAASFSLLAIAAILLSAGKRRFRVEVDAGVSVGVMFSLFSACTGLGMSLNRRDDLPLSYRLLVGAAFVTSCLLNGVLLVIVLGNAP